MSIRALSQKHLPQPFGLSLSRKPGRSFNAALRQAQSERACLEIVNQAKMASSA